MTADTPTDDETETDEYGRDPIHDDETKWTLHLDGLSFNTSMVKPTGTSKQEVEVEATELLIKAIREGEVTPRWNAIARDAETRRRHREMTDTIRCDRCDDPNHGEMREIPVDSELYEIDFEIPEDSTVPDGTQYVSVCESCRDEMWAKAHDDSE